jgi:hypothetical protein
MGFETIRWVGWGSARRVAVMLLCCVSFTLLLCGTASARGATGGHVVFHAPHKVKIGKVLVVRVRSRIAAPSTVRLQQRRGRRWRVVATKHVRRGSHARLRWRVRSPLPYLTLRATVRSRHRRSSSRRRRVRILRPRRILAPKRIGAAPRPGARGSLRYRGRVRVRPGAVVAAGVGPHTPYGFLGLVTGVSHHRGSTKLKVRPTTLMTALPSGSFKVKSTRLRALNSTARSNSRASVAPRRPKRIWRKVHLGVHCKGGGQVTVAGSVSVAPVVSMKASWSLFGGVSASFKAGMTASADLSAAAQAAAGCTVGPKTLARWKLAPIDVQVGPIPVVLVPQVEIVLAGDGSVSASVSTGVHGSVTATGGIAYDHGRFHPIGGVNPQLGFDPPSPSGKAHLGGEIGPSVSLLLYGVAGPKVDLRGGVALDADVTADPWWRLTAPIDLSAELAIPDVGIESGKLTIYHEDIALAQAAGPFGGPPPPPAPPPAPVAGGITFDGSPGTGSPPATLGPYQMTPFGPDGQELGYVTGVDGPTGRIGFSTELEHFYANEEPAWRTWSNGYEGDVYANLTESSVTVDLPAGTKAFYLYAEPDIFSTFDIIARTQDGTTSGEVPVYGEAGATYFGFYATGSATIDSVTVECPEDDFAIGEFGISSG